MPDILFGQSDKVVEPNPKIQPILEAARVDPEKAGKQAANIYNAAADLDLPYSLLEAYSQPDRWIPGVPEALQTISGYALPPSAAEIAPEEAEHVRQLFRLSSDKTKETKETDDSVPEWLSRYGLNWQSNPFLQYAAYEAALGKPGQIPPQIRAIFTEQTGYTYDPAWGTMRPMTKTEAARNHLLRGLMNTTKAGLMGISATPAIAAGLAMEASLAPQMTAGYARELQMYGPQGKPELTKTGEQPPERPRPISAIGVFPAAVGKSIAEAFNNFMSERPEYFATQQKTGGWGIYFSDPYQVVLDSLETMPYMGAIAAGTAASGGLGGLAVAASLSYGSALEAALNEGMDPGAAVLAALVIAPIEGGIETLQVTQITRMLPGFEKLKAQFARAISKKVFGKLGAEAGRVGVVWLANGVNEGIEEFLQEFYRTEVISLVGGKPIDRNQLKSDLAEAFMRGAGVGLILSGSRAAIDLGLVGGEALSEASAARRNQQITELSVLIQQGIPADRAMSFILQKYGAAQPGFARIGKGAKLTQGYLDEQINYGGELRSRGSVIAEMQKQGFTEKQIGGYMAGQQAAKMIGKVGPETTPSVETEPGVKPKIEPTEAVPPAKPPPTTAELPAEQPEEPPEKPLVVKSKSGKEYKFVASIREAMPELGERVRGEHIVRDTDELAMQARTLVQDDISTAEHVAANDKSDASVAIAIELARHYQHEASTATSEATKEAMYQKSAELLNAKAEQLMEAGRFVQAASILTRQTPEGLAYFAAAQIKRWNQDVIERGGGVLGISRKQVPELTGEQTQYIMTEMADVQQMPPGKQRNLRLHRLQNYISDLVPTPLMKQFVTIWKAGLLTGIKTTGVNIGANLFHLQSEIIKDIPASMVDAVASIFTGKRKLVFTTKGTVKGFGEGFGHLKDYLIHGLDERNIGVKLDYKRVKFAKALAWAGPYTQLVFRVLGSEDQPFYYAALTRSLFDQAKAQAINKKLRGATASSFIYNLVNNPTNAMKAYAAKDAETAVFQNRTSLGDIAKKIQNIGGEWIIPFGRTPSAVAMQIVNYSPAGFVKTLIQNIGKGKWDQRAFAQGMGRATVGTVGALWAGGQLFLAGRLTLGWPNNEKEREQQRLENKKSNAVLINGKWRSVYVLGPIGNLLLIGGYFQKNLKESGSVTEAMAKTVFDSGKSLTEQTFLTGLNQFTAALADPERSFPRLARGLLSSVIPTLVGDIARASDPLERQAITVGTAFQAKIPGVRRGLEPQIDVLGRKQPAQGTPLELLFDPTRPITAQTDPITEELRRLWDKGYLVTPTLLGPRKGYKSLTPQENTMLLELVGQEIKGRIQAAMGTELWPTQADEEKAGEIDAIVQQAQLEAKRDAVDTKLANLTGDARSDAIVALALDHLIDRERLVKDFINGKEINANGLRRLLNAGRIAPHEAQQNQLIIPAPSP